MTDLEEPKHRYVYMVRFSEEHGLWEIFYPDLPGLSTWVEAKDEIGPEADFILTIWLQNVIDSGKPLPRPAAHPFTWPMAQRTTTPNIS